jgi:hypothetical protein
MAQAHPLLEVGNVGISETMVASEARALLCAEGSSEPSVVSTGSRICSR